MSGQKTLFQAWGAPVPQKSGQVNDAGKKIAGRRKATIKPAAGRTKKKANDTPLLPPRTSLWGGIGHGTSAQCEIESVAEEDDDLMLVAVYEAEKSLENVSHTNATGDANAQVTSFVTSPVLTASGSVDYSSELPGFDRSSAEVWIYPTNYPIRDYQLKISEKALFQNTLVCLPTGLGKTFIAAVVMYNFYRWYPAGKIVFMAPTKPLVAQQIEACYKVMGIPWPRTGSNPAQMRREQWKSRRVFFLTPQVMVNDLSHGACPASQVKCVVIDEAHKAQANHAYCQ
ncbi:hypothetical protein AAFF_G00375720, partial [Aldrovandia affinis]